MVLRKGQRRIPAHDDVGKPEGVLFTACAAALQSSTEVCIGVSGGLTYIVSTLNGSVSRVDMMDAKLKIS